MCNKLSCALFTVVVVGALMMPFSVRGFIFVIGLLMYVACRASESAYTNMEYVSSDDHEADDTCCQACFHPKHTSAACRDDECYCLAESR